MPTEPAWEGPPTASAIEEGIRVEVWHQGREVVIGERVFAHVRVTNESDRRIFRETSCGVGLARVTVDYSASLPKGQAWTGMAQRFKEELLREGRYGVGQFVGTEWLDQGNRVCADVFTGEYLEPGEALESSLAWDVVGYPLRPVLPGAADAVATLRYWLDETAVPEDDVTVSAATEVQLTGDATPETPVVEYVDRALAEPRFAEWLEEEPPSTWINTHITTWPNEEGQYPDQPCYADATEGAIDIGLFRMVDGGDGYGAVTLDLPSGELLGVRFQGGAVQEPCSP